MVCLDQFVIKKIILKQQFRYDIILYVLKILPDMNNLSSMVN